MMMTAFLFTLAAAQPVPFDATRWTTDPGVTTLSYLGRPSLFIDSGPTLRKDSSFGDGPIEVDVALQQGHPGFAGLVFRAASKNDYELVYLRLLLSRRPDARQYMPVFHGVAAWQLYSGKGYTGAAELPADRWVHVKLVVSGYEARLYVDGAATPQLTITDLKRPWAHGQVGLWGGLSGGAFSNFTLSPADPGAPAPPPPTA